VTMTCYSTVSTYEIEFQRSKQEGWFLGLFVQYTLTRTSPFARLGSLRKARWRVAHTPVSSLKQEA